MSARLLVFVFALASTGMAHAAGSGRAAADVTDELPGRPGVTYAALLAQFMPGLAVDAEGVWTAPDITGLRRLDGEPADAAPFSFRSVETLAMRSDGRPVLLVATEGDPAGGEFSMILAAYDMTPAVPRLVDYVDAGMDRWTDLGVTLTLAEGNDAFAMRGHHDNSSESFEATGIAFLREGRFAPIASVLAYGAQGCGWQTTQEAAYDTQPDPGARYSAVVLSVTQETLMRAEACDGGETWPEPGTVVFTDIYRWDEARGIFASATNNLGKALGPE